MILSDIKLRETSCIPEPNATLFESNLNNANRKLRIFMIKNVISANSGMSVSMVINGHRGFPLRDNVLLPATRWIDIIVRHSV
jgi:hypothetical protein